MRLTTEQLAQRRYFADEGFDREVNVGHILSVEIQVRIGFVTS